MNYVLCPSKVFLSQLPKFNEQEKRLILEKLELVKLNPFRYKSLYAPGLTKTFEIKLTLQGIYSRLIYWIEGNEIKIAGVIARKNDFKDLLKLLYEARQE